MKNLTKINNDIYRLTVPYADVFTSVYAIRTKDGAMLFDTATYDEDFEKYTLPFLTEIGISEAELKYVFLSHSHEDHAGGLKAILKKYPECVVVSASAKLEEEYKNYSFLNPGDGETFLGVLKVVKIPGHTLDSMAVLDTRTKTLISGDSLQMYGLFGSGKWGANIILPKKHEQAIEKLKKMDIECILTAHDYHPHGYRFCGKDEVGKCFELCIEPLNKIRHLILNNSELDDKEICSIYNSCDVPEIGMHVVTALRNEFNMK